MRIGLVLPQTEITADFGAVLEFGQEIERLGYTHLLAYDHVLGADSTTRPGWSGAYDHRVPFLEPLVTFAHLAARTSLDFATGVMVLPQRQTALVAKQAVTLDCLAPGRLRLGVGLGWNTVEYLGLGQDFSSRAARLEEQIIVLRRLFTEPVVEHQGRWDVIDRAGILPLPAKPIPIWIGGGSAGRSLDRVGRLADGWMPKPEIFPGHGLEAALDRIAAAARAAGRAPEAIGLEGHLAFAGGDTAKLRRRIGAWRDAGADSVVIATMRAGAGWPDGHLELARGAAEAFAEST